MASMRPGVTPNKIHPFLQYQNSTLHNLETVTDEDGLESFGGVSTDGCVSWMVHGSVIEIISTVTRNRLAAWQFGTVMKDQHTQITCVKPIKVDGAYKFLIGVYNNTNVGMLCILDISCGSVVKAIEIPHKVTSIELITTDYGDQSPRWALSEVLRNFYGVAAVGTECGYVYLLDLCLDEGSQSDELMPTKLKFVSPRTRDLNLARHQAESRGQQLCMTLDEDSHGRNGYKYRRPDESVICAFKVEMIAITCLKYIVQSGTLVVGFSFGGYQLWKLSTPTLEYTSRVDEEECPVTNVAYQEPENDPKNFTYLWISRGPCFIYPLENTLSTLTLYQLAFNKKTWYGNYGVFYEDLASVFHRLDFVLNSDPWNLKNSSSTSSQLISCFTLDDPLYQPPKRLTDESFDEGAHGADSSLCVFVWDSREGEGRNNISYRLGIFDMNRWYHAQMPTTLRCLGDLVNTCTYFTSCKLDSIADIAFPDSLLAVHIPADSVKKFINNAPLPPEQHFYPSALAFTTVCLLESGIIRAEFLGTQRQVLANLQKAGPLALLNPQDFFILCSQVGLLPKTIDSIGKTLPAVQREALLSMLLEYNMITFIKRCVLEWAAGEFVHKDCTLKFLLEWAWKKLKQIKQNIDIITSPLYDCSGLHLDQRALYSLHQSHQLINHMISIFTMFLHQSGPTTEEGFAELESRLNAIILLSQHLDIVLWFVNKGLLPEVDELSEPMPNIYCYPAAGLIQAYNNRRRELVKLHSDIGAKDILLIDGLVQSMGSSMGDLWEKDGGKGCYPPPSLNCLMNIYLLGDTDLLMKHCVVLYLLLDLVSVIDSSRHEEFTARIITFAESFNIPQSIVKQVQGFWLLDHLDFEEAATALLNPMITSELGRWQHCRVVKSLLFQGHSRVALRYLNKWNPSLATPEEVKLKLTVLLDNDEVAQALEFQRKYRDQDNMKDLLHHLFLGCQQTKMVDKLLQLPLTETEESLLREYLTESLEPHSQELLVMHNLQRYRLVEAIRLNEKLKHRVVLESSAKARERAAARNAIIDGFTDILPGVQRKLLFDPVGISKKSKVIRKDVSRPKPLSTILSKTQSAVISRATLIMQVMEKVHEIKYEDEVMESSVSPKECEKSEGYGPFICAPVTPRKMSANQTGSKCVVYPNISEETKSANSSTVSSPSTFTPYSPEARSKQPLSTGPKKLTRFKNVDALIMLQTPTIIKKKSPKQHRLLSMSATPQSILKVKHMISRSPSPQITSGSNTPKGSDKEKEKRPQLRTRLANRLALSLETSANTSGTPKQLRFAEAVEQITPSPPALSPTTHAEPVKFSPGPPSRKLSDRMQTPKAHQQRTPPSCLKQGRSVFTPKTSTLSKNSSHVSPPSPRTVKDRSPTPERSSPKKSPSIEKAMPRPPLHSPEVTVVTYAKHDRKTESDELSVKGYISEAKEESKMEIVDEEITFNLIDSDVEIAGVERMEDDSTEELKTLPKEVTFDRHILPLSESTSQIHSDTSKSSLQDSSDYSKVISLLTPENKQSVPAVSIPEELIKTPYYSPLKIMSKLPDRKSTVKVDKNPRTPVKYSDIFSSIKCEEKVSVEMSIQTSPPPVDEPIEIDLTEDDVEEEVVVEEEKQTEIQKHQQSSTEESFSFSNPYVIEELIDDQVSSSCDVKDISDSVVLPDTTTIDADSNEVEQLAEHTSENVCEKNEVETEQEETLNLHLDDSEAEETDCESSPTVSQPSVLLPVSELQPVENSNCDNQVLEIFDSPVTCHAIQERTVSESDCVNLPLENVEQIYEEQVGSSDIMEYVDDNQKDDVNNDRIESTELEYHIHEPAVSETPTVHIEIPEESSVMLTPKPSPGRRRGRPSKSITKPPNQPGTSVTSDEYSIQSEAESVTPNKSSTQTGTDRFTPNKYSTRSQTEGVTPNKYSTRSRTEGVTPNKYSTRAAKNSVTPNKYSTGADRAFENHHSTRSVTRTVTSVCSSSDNTDSIMQQHADTPQIECITPNKYSTRSGTSGVTLNKFSTRSSQKEQSLDETFKTPTKNPMLELKTPEDDEESGPVGRRQSGRRSTTPSRPLTPTRRSSRINSQSTTKTPPKSTSRKKKKEVDEELEKDSVKEKVDVVDEPMSTIFTFSEPTQVIAPEDEVFVSSKNLERSFIFSPPLTRRRSSMNKTDITESRPSTSILLPPVIPEEESETNPQQPLPTTKVKKKPKQREKKKSYAISPSNESIVLISPLPTRRSPRKHESKDPESSDKPMKKLRLRQRKQKSYKL